MKANKKALTGKKIAPKPKVDIGLPTYGLVPAAWWVPVTTRLLQEAHSPYFEMGELRGLTSAMPDHNRNNILDRRERKPVVSAAEDKGRASNTDMLQSALVGLGLDGRPLSDGFMGGTADYLLLMEDDVEPPPGFISSLIKLKRDIVGALCFNGAWPHNPIAYMRNPETGLYSAMWDYSPGQLQQFDSVGTGCTLIHRGVFENVQKAHEVFYRPNGTLLPIPKKDVHGEGPANLNRPEVRDGVLMMPVKKMDPDDTRPWPFFAMEYSRTQDHYFYELCAEVGIKPWLDTAIVCNHWKLKPQSREQHKEVLEKVPVDYEKR